MVNKLFKLSLILILINLITTKLAYVATILRHGARYPLTDMYDGN